MDKFNKELVLKNLHYTRDFVDDAIVNVEKGDLAGALYWLVNAIHHLGLVLYEVYGWAPQPDHVVAKPSQRWQVWKKRVMPPTAGGWSTREEYVRDTKEQAWKLAEHFKRQLTVVDVRVLPVGERPEEHDGNSDV